MSKALTRFQRISKTLGPGLLFAGAAIGGSHLIQSTRAGADYGFKLLGLVLLINILKYPFFEFAQRYTVVNEKSLLRGYADLGYWVLIVYLLLTIATAIPTIAAVSFINANIANYILDVTISPAVTNIGLLTICSIILLIGKYTWLDRTIKIILLLLAISTIAAVAISLPTGMHTIMTTSSPPILNLAGMSFMLALMGWMPAPIEVSVWLSLWSRQKSRDTKYTPSLKESLFDFHIGYFGSVILAIGFVALGALVMFGSGETFSSSGVIFTEQLIALYTSHFGNWTAPLIAIAAFTTMFSTTLTCLDAYPRAISAATSLAFPKTKPFKSIIYWAVILTLFFSSILISAQYTRHMKQLVDLATIIAFLTAPVFAYLNYRVVTHKDLMPKSHQPPKWLLILSRVGLAFLVLVSVTYTVWNLVA